MKNGFVLEFQMALEAGSTDEQTPAGKNEAQKLCQALSALGAECHSVMQRSFYGWDFIGKFEGRNYLVVVQVVGTCWSVTVSQTGYTNFMSAQHPVRESLSQLEEMTVRAIENEFKVEPVKVGWGFFGLSI